MSAVHKMDRTTHEDSSVRSLASDLAWIRAAGFATATRVESLLVRFAALASARGSDPAALLDAALSVALEVREENRRVALAQLASRARRRAV